MEFRHASVEMDDGVSVGGGVDTLFFVKVVCFPVRELRALRYALPKEVGPEFLETHVFDAHTCC